jgi:Mg-chelatase subunit ChlD
MTAQTASADELLRRWRLILGGGEGEGTGQKLEGIDIGVDNALDMLYNGEQGGSLDESAPNIARWLGDIRAYFPTPVVQMLQRDAIERLKLRQLLLEPEMLSAVEPDVHLIATLLSLNEVMPTQTRDTARQVVQRVVQELERRLATPTRQAVTGSLNRAERNHHPRHNEIDWPRTILTNLKHYQPEYKTIIPETRIGHGRKRSSLRDLILCIDESGSMATSVVYASIFGAVLASLPAMRTHMIVFDTSVVDLTAELHDPVELLFGTQLCGGTDINRALEYCQGLIRRPKQTVLVLISDLFEGGDREEMIQRAHSIVGSGVQFISLLALNDDGAPGYDHAVAETFAAMGIPAFACTPDLFPGLMASAINRYDIGQWAATNGVITAQGSGR